MNRLISTLHRLLGGRPESKRLVLHDLVEQLDSDDEAAVARALYTLIALPATDVERSVLEACDILQSDAAREYSDRYLSLIALARSTSVESALHRRAQKLDREVHALGLFLAATSSVHMRWLIDEYPSLLSFRTALALDALIRNSPDMFDHDVTVRSRVLADCRRDSVAKTLPHSDTNVPDDGLVPPDSLFRQLLATQWNDDTAALLEEHPGFLDRRFDQFLRLRVLKSKSEAIIFRIGRVEQSSDTRFSLIQLAFSFRPDEDRPFRKARLSARLYADNVENEQQRPIAWSLDPRVLAESVQTVRKTTLSTGLKFFDVGITGGGEVTETTNRTVPFLEAFGELESEPYWEFTRTPSRDIRGPFRFSMIVKSSGADQAHADFAIRIEVEITRFGFRTYRTAAAGVEALKVRLA